MTVATAVRSPAGFVAFARALAAGVGDGSVRLENASVVDFLESVAAWIVDVDDATYGPDGLPRNAAAWGLAARLLVAGLQYE